MLPSQWLWFVFGICLALTLFLLGFLSGWLTYACLFWQQKRRERIGTFPVARRSLAHLISRKQRLGFAALILVNLLYASFPLTATHLLTHFDPLLLVCAQMLFLLPKGLEEVEESSAQLEFIMIFSISRRFA